METARQKLIREMTLRLGGGMVDIELDPEHFEFAIDAALDRYRQRSGNALEESFVFLDIQPQVQNYTMPNEVQIVRSIYRRGIGGAAGGGASVDPFSLAFTNNLYMIQNPGGLGGGGSGTLATYDFAMQFQELAGRMFGRDVMFTWDAASKRLTLQRKFHSVEQIAVHVYNTRPEEIMLTDVYAKPWLRDCSIAYAKIMIGEARSKFQNLGGPQGGVSLNGDAMKQEGQADLDRLELEIQNIIDGNQGYPFLIG
jgi:hypothetical protein